jgi:hypothetical protein
MTDDTQYVNLTPHPVALMPEDGEPTTIPASGVVARITETSITVGGRTVIELGDVVGLPEPDPAVTLIVSMPLLMALAAKGIHRRDLVYPYGQVRDLSGRILGCRMLATLRVS